MDLLQNFNRAADDRLVAEGDGDAVLAEFPVGDGDAVLAGLPDGSMVLLMPMSPDDDERLVRFHGRLSPETTHRRFFSIHPELSPEEVHRFTHVDHLDREAIIAVADGEIVGVARFDRLVGVDDTWQGRGLGTVLFDHLADRARDLGVARFVAQTLPDNRPMLSVFRHAGRPIVEQYEDGIVDVTIDL